MEMDGDKFRGVGIKSEEIGIKSEESEISEKCKPTALILNVQVNLLY